MTVPPIRGGGDFDVLSQVARTEHTFAAHRLCAKVGALGQVHDLEAVMKYKRQSTTLAAVLLMSLAAAFAGCGGGGEASASPPAPPLIPAAVLSSLSPPGAFAGGGSFTLTLNGSNFAPSTTVLWNGKSLPTTFVSSQQVTAAISASLIASVGVVSVIALNAHSTDSNALQFSIHNAPPQITAITPNNAIAGAAPVVVVVEGTNFSDEATVLLDGSPRATYPRSATELQVTISASDLATARSIAITVEDPDLATGRSNPVPFTVTPFTSNLTPTLVSASDPSVPQGWPGFQLTVEGTNFVAASVLEWDGAQRQTTVISSTELKAAIPAALLVSPKAAQIAVVNPSPGGGTSSPLSIQVEAVPPAAIGVVERSDIATDLSEPNGNSASAAVSADGRFVVFLSSASNLVPNTPDSNGQPNFLLRDTCIGAPNGCVPSLALLSNGSFFYRPAISANARFVGFSSGTGFLMDDTCVGAPAGCVSATRPIDIPENAEVGQISLSADGRFAVYLAGLFSCGDFDYGCSPPEGQVFLADTCAGVSSGCTPTSRPITPGQVPEDEAASSGGFIHPFISPDGRFVAFNSTHSDVWLYDSCQGISPGCSPSETMVSMASDGRAANADSFGAAVSAGGRYVAFLSTATNLVPGLSEPGALRVYLRDMCTGAPSGCTAATTAISIAGDGTTADDPSISADGRYITFASAAAGLVPGDTNGAMDVFVYDTCIGVLSGCATSTVRASVALDGTQGNNDSFRPVISADGRFVVFISAAKLGPGSPNSLGGDVYLARH
jgi:Tol biopolymer transport system component